MAASTPQFAADVATTVTKIHDGNRRDALCTLVGAVAYLCEGDQAVEWMDIAIVAISTARDLAAARRTAATTRPIGVPS